MWTEINIPLVIRCKFPHRYAVCLICKQFSFVFEMICAEPIIFFLTQDGVPRTAYKGVVVFRYQTRKRVFLVGPESLQQLGIE